jgi:enoyl-[acyl-carrier-protein] reductase (NADH)
MARLMNITPQQAAGALAQQTMLKLSPQTTDTAKAAAFLASEDARMITGAVLNASAGAVTD